MGLVAHKMIATGRASCKVCGKKIIKGIKSIMITGYRETGQVHANEVECDISWRERIKR